MRDHFEKIADELERELKKQQDAQKQQEEKISLMRQRKVD